MQCIETYGGYIYPVWQYLPLDVACAGGLQHPQISSLAAGLLIQPAAATERSDTFKVCLMSESCHQWKCKKKTTEKRSLKSGFWKKIHTENTVALSAMVFRCVTEGLRADGRLLSVSPSAWNNIACMRLISIAWFLQLLQMSPYPWLHLEVHSKDICSSYW